MTDRMTIGMAMSGGGYRASAFHLGTLAYLDRVGLLAGLSAISTVSGGSFTGASLALSLADGESFKDFFKRFYCDLRDVDLVRRGLDQLGRDSPGVPSGRRDLIVSMARVYAETFFAPQPSEPRKASRTFGELLDASTQLKAISLNATEFRTGIAFRFQTSQNDRGLIGNGNVWISPDVARQVRVADIVASSSCFPGGFEPMAFPHDFAWPDGQIPAALQKEPFLAPVPLMDGGVYDNQGLDSLLLADDRMETYDLILISDVDEPVKDLFPFPPPIRLGGAGRLTLGTISVLMWLLMALCAVSAGSLVVRLWSGDVVGVWPITAHVMPILLAFGTAGLLLHLRRLVRHTLLPMIPQVHSAGWKDFKRLTLEQLANMANLRVRSLVAMASSIFMKRIRALGYRIVYGDPRFQHRRVSNLIYHLAPGEEFAPELKKLVQEPSLALLNVTYVAATMPTTLWFDEAYQEPCLVATGQATICYNLMKFVVRECGPDVGQYHSDIGALWNKLNADWRTLNDDPYALLKGRLPKDGPLACPPEYPDGPTSLKSVHP